MPVDPMYSIILSSKRIPWRLCAASIPLFVVPNGHTCYGTNAGGGLTKPVTVVAQRNSDLKGHPLLIATRTTIGKPLRCDWHLDSMDGKHHDADMRTTLTLDPDIERRLKDIAHRTRTSFREVVNAVLRAGLEKGSRQAMERTPFHVQARHCGFRPGVDLQRLNQLTDDLEADRVLGKG